AGGAMGGLEGGIEDLERGRAKDLGEPTRRLNTVVSGADGLFATRQQEIEAIRSGHRLVALNASFGERLSLTVSQLVRQARKDVNAAIPAAAPPPPPRPPLPPAPP